MTVHVFQDIILQMKDVLKSTVGVIDMSGRVIACSDPAYLNTTRNTASLAASLPTDNFTFEGYTYGTNRYQIQ